MISGTSVVAAGLQMGLESILIAPRVANIQNIIIDGQSLSDIQAHVTIEETGTDELEITDHPVQQGASIADHAFKLPAEIVLKMGWSNSPSESNGMVNSAIAFAAANSPVINALTNLAVIGSAIESVRSGGASASFLDATYAQLLHLQERRAIFDVYSTRRKYSNMVCKSLAVQTDYKTANAMFITMTCKQVILVNTSTVMIAQATAANPAANASIVDKGTSQLKGAQDVTTMSNPQLKTVLSTK